MLSEGCGSNQIGFAESLKLQMVDWLRDMISLRTFVTSELSGAALAASGGGPKGRNALERLVSFHPAPQGAPEMRVRLYCD